MRKAKLNTFLNMKVNNSKSMKKVFSKQELFRKRYYFIAVILLWIYIIFVNNPFDSTKGTLREETFGGRANGVICEITKDIIVEQKFVANENNLNSIKFFMATYARENKGNISILVKDETSDAVVYSGNIAMNTINDNAWLNISFPNQVDSLGHKYHIKIYSKDASEGNAVTVYFAEDKASNHTQINGENIAGTINFLTGYQVESLQYLKIICWAIVIFLSLFFVAIVGKADEKMFLKFGILFGLIVVLLNPFVHAIDESTHFFRSFMISQGNLLDITNAQGVIGGNVSDNYANIVEKNLSIKTYFTDHEVWNQAFHSTKTFYGNPYMSSVTPINHMIAAVGIFIGRLLCLPAILVILLGRLCDLLFYIAFSYLAIKKAKYYKNMFFIIATLPMGIWLAGSYSIDPILISSSLLFSSICLRYYFEQEEMIKKSELVLLIVCGIFISSVKYLVYTPILLLFFLIPKDRFKKKQYIMEICIAVLMVVVMAFIQLYMLKSFTFTEDRNGDVNVSRQIIYMINNITVTLQNFAIYFVSSSLDHIEGFSYISAVPVITALTGLFAIFGSAIEVRKYNFTNSKKKFRFVMLSLFIVVVVFMLTIVALYVGFTPVGKFAVEGLQTRYLIPVILFLMIPISYIDVQNNIKNYEEKVTMIMGIGMINMMAGILLNVFA